MRNIIRLSILFAAVSAISAAPAKAAPSRFQLTPPGGMPFCIDPDEFKEMMAAIVRKDTSYADSLKTCRIINGGQRIEFLEEGFNLDGIRAGRVRVFGTGGSFDGTGIISGEAGKTGNIHVEPSPQPKTSTPKVPLTIEVSP